MFEWGADLMLMLVGSVMLISLLELYLLDIKLAMNAQTPPIKGHSKLTLAILLVVLLCQFFSLGSAFSVQ